jgi:Transglutaminase-like superfamily
MLAWSELIRLSNTELAAQDLAAVNLACAAGLPGAEDLDVEGCLKMLAAWTAQVGRETARCAVQFQREPTAFENSWAYFRVLVLATVLQQDCGVRYDPTLIDREDFFADARNLFIHGILQGRGGTCSSLPPLYVAVGRRLGYPLKLVLSNSHVFARWDDPATAERFNVECTSRGLNCHPDGHYLAWPLPTTASEAAACGWLTSLTLLQELATFLANRGHCWLDNRRFHEAVDAYAWASSLAPGLPGHEAWLDAALKRWRS